MTKEVLREKIMNVIFSEAQYFIFNKYGSRIMESVAKNIRRPHFTRNNSEMTGGLFAIENKIEKDINEVISRENDIR